MRFSASRLQQATTDRLLRRLLPGGQRGESRAVIFANVHVLMEAFDDASFRAKLNAADMVNPDGMAAGLGAPGNGGARCNQGVWAGCHGGSSPGRARLGDSGRVLRRKRGDADED